MPPPEPLPSSVPQVSPTAPPGSPPLPPGTVIDHLDASGRQYVGSPSLAVIGPGVYVASHDNFGRGSSAKSSGATHIFRSEDHGATWRHAARVQPAFWSNLFVHRGALYLLGTTHIHGLLVIRRSLDGGLTWTTPADAASGLLTEAGQYHTAPTPTVVHRGRLWRAVEDAGGGTKWGARYRPMILSAPAEADLLDRRNWRLSTFLTHDTHWLNGRFHAWLEGNAVPDPDGGMINLLRVDHPAGNRAAYVKVSEDGAKLVFDPATGFIPFPGGATKFQLRQDPGGGGYWALSNACATQTGCFAAASEVRNTLALLHSDDLRRWKIRAILLHHPDSALHAFQYPDWEFEGDDLIAVLRTAFDDGEGGARSFHDANFLTFHRFENFRKLQSASLIDTRGLCLIQPG